MIYTCCEEKRRALVDAHATLNGIDWLEVLDLDAPAGSPRQRTLMVRLLKRVPSGLTPDNIRIDGGDRIRNVGVEWVGVASAPPATETTSAEKTFFTALPEADHVLLVRTDSSGDHSMYRLRLVSGSGDDAAITGFDPRLSAVDFSFKVECPSDFDCAPTNACRTEPGPTPDLNYLARDYESLRRLVIDRLARQMPGWRERSAADLAVTLAELIAYVGDLQHYQLDAVTTEGYLRTARRRTSLRRHALLVDYAVNEGCNARTWLHLEVDDGPFVLPTDIRFYTRVPGVPQRFAPDSPEERLALQSGPLVFETMHQPTLRAEHNQFRFYTWSDERCCLPTGATQATLRGHWPDLAAGDVLIFKEMTGPLTGQAEDADPAHRHAVRLTEVRAFDDTDPPLTNPLTDPLDGTKITQITWHPDDALPFSLCLSSETDKEHHHVLIEDVSVVLGNNVLVDHGRTIVDKSLGNVPAPRFQYPLQLGNPCNRPEREPIPPKYRPPLAQGPVTMQGRVTRTVTVHGQRTTEQILFDPDAGANSALHWDPKDAMPSISLEGKQGALTKPWNARHDLLASHATDRHFVLETEDDGSATLRFGDGRYGRRPDVGTEFTATYRVGNGPAGNVGANAISHAVTTEGRIREVANPLPARGGTAPETAAEIRRHAPNAFRTIERAVTRADYAVITERLSGVQQAAADWRWTGSWSTVFVTVDRLGGVPVDDAFASDTVAYLDRYRMAGYDLHVDDPIHVSLELRLLICVDSEHFRSDVQRGLLDVLSNRVLPDGTRGLFHPDNFSFGQTVYLSPIYSAARTVPGVESVQVVQFSRQGQKDPKPREDGFMLMGQLEIARLDNDPDFPEHGVLGLELHGGK